MKLSKYEHACLILDNDQTKLIIDPGCFTNLPDNLEGIGILAITEEHLDHFDINNIRKILNQNPNVKIFSTKVVFEKLSQENINSSAVSGSKTISEGGYSLSFNETPHAPTYRVSPCQSLSLRVDDFLYYPSDSYRTTNEPVEVLALPTGGPWHKIEEAVDFANAISSKIILATHNGLYNDNGQNVANNFIKINIAQSDRDYVYLEPGESL